MWFSFARASSGKRYHVVMFSACLLAIFASPAVPQEHARRDVAEAMLLDLQTERHRSDGAGSSWMLVEESDMQCAAGGRGQWHIVYRVGVEGIAEGGAIFLQVPPFWEWSSPQTWDEREIGWTLVDVSAEVEWESSTVDQQLLMVKIVKGSLRENDTVHFVYKGRADKYAESAAAFWCSVDGNGDGVRALVKDRKDMDVQVLGGRASQVHMNINSTLVPGGFARLRFAFLDWAGNATSGSIDEFHFTFPKGAEPLGEPTFDNGVGWIDIKLNLEGIHEVKVKTPLGTFESNPIVVRKGIENVLWADLQVHTAISDGTGSLDDVYRYARDIAGLDAVCITDHDHWGMEFLDQSPKVWQEIKAAADNWNQANEFVAFLGFEWTNWIYGHRHVIYKGQIGEIYSSLDERYDTPQELWKALDGQSALTIAHHSAGGAVATDWSISPDPKFEPVTEIVSVHGSSEASDSPGRIYNAKKNNFVRDALGRGYQLGFIGSTDGHDGHPGLAHLAGTSGGVVAIFSEDKTRDGIMQALRERRCYATNGPRILLRFELGEARMGETVKAGIDDLELTCRVVGTGPIERVDVISGDQVVTAVSANQQEVFFFSAVVPPMKVGEFVYVRVVQSDGGTAWSSPIWAK